MKKILLPSTILASTRIYALCKEASEIWIEQHEHYQKRSMRNRFLLLGANGPKFFSIPLQKGKNARKPIREVMISYDEDWVREFRHTLMSNYGNAPFFDYYSEELLHIFSKKHTLLYDLNHEVMLWVFKCLSISTEKLHFTQKYDPNVSTDILDLRTSLPPTPAIKEYPQIFEDKFGFQRDASIIDLIMCMGPEATIYL